MFTLLKKLFAPKAPAPPAIDIPKKMKYLIVGLGNIGADYDQTRHNVGFEVADALARQFEASFSLGAHAATATFKHKGRQFTLVKPTTYMNLSGKAVRYWLQKLDIPKENLLVVVDDLNLPFGKMRMRPSGSHGGHNGLKDIDAMLNGNMYARLRIGIGDNFGKGQQVNYVLGKWSPKERETLPDILQRAAAAAVEFATIGIALAMNNANK